MLQSPKQSCFARRLISATSVAILASSLCACQTTSPSDIADITGSLGDKAASSHTSDARRDVEVYRERYRANPKDVDTALKYGKALRDAGQRSQAVAVLEQATLDQPGNKALLGGYGRALADNGNFQQAFDVLSRAHTPEDPDWRHPFGPGCGTRSARTYEEARQYYATR